MRHIIEKGTKLYTYHTNCSLVVATVILAVASPGSVEAVMSLTCELLDATATASVLITEDSKNYHRIVVKLQSIISQEDDDEETPEDFWEELFNTREFKFKAASAYSSYCSKQLKELEVKSKQDIEGCTQAIDKIASNVEALKKALEEPEGLLEYAKRYGLFKPELTKEALLKEASEIGDTVFTHISLYGIHTFTIFAQPAEGVFMLEGLNKYTDEKVVFECVDASSCLVVKNAVVGEGSKHWYSSLDGSSAESLPYGVLIRKSAAQAIKDSIKADISSLRRSLKEAKDQKIHVQNKWAVLISTLSSNNRGLKDSARV